MSLTSEIIQTVNNSNVINEPFPHMNINEFFENEFYMKLLKSLPKKEEYVQINKTGSAPDKYPDERFVFDLNKESLNNLDKFKQDTLMEIIKGFTSFDFFRATTLKFNDVIQERVQNFSKKEIDLFGKNNFKFNIRISLVKDFSKYLLGSHTDSISKVLTFLFYIPEDKSLEHCGTSLYKPRDIPTFTHELQYNINDTKKYFTEEKRIPFIPNSVLIFPRTNFSYHGVSSLNIGSKARNLLLLNYYFKNI